MISEEQRRKLQHEAVIAEQLGTLTKTQLDVIYQAGWFRMYLPQSLSGLGVTLPEGLRLEEELARIDGSLGWTVTLCSGATMFAGFLKPELASQLLDDPHACFGGSGAPHGTAEHDEDHFIINGRWKYATGEPHLTAFTANCKVTKNGIEQRDSLGQPIIRAFIFKAEEVHVEDDWNTMGLVASAGHTFSVKDLRIPSERAFDIVPEAARIDDPIFHYPFIPFAETTLAVNTLGMTQHFLECCGRIFTAKYTGEPHYLERLQTLKIKLEGLRGAFYMAVDKSWEELMSVGQCNDETLKAVHNTSVDLVWRSREIVVELFPYCGMSGTTPDSEINRAWRDIFTASQHALLNRLNASH